MSRCRFAFAIGLATLGSSHAVAADGLVRIEPRPYYGAVITMEQGVRVYRPLPNQSLTIINPNQTPINLSFSRTVEHRAAENVSSSGGDGSGGSYGGGVAGLPYGLGGKDRDRAGAGGHRVGPGTPHRHAPRHR